MGSYSIDNVTAVQGRYADVVATPQTTGIRPKAPIEANRAADAAFKAKGRKGSAENAVEKAKNEALEPKVFSTAEEEKAKEELANDENKMESITETLNKFVAQFSSDLKFALHKDTNILTVKFVDVKSNKVLKEFPSEEYLNMIANIRKFIGAMVDEKV